MLKSKMKPVQLQIIKIKKIEFTNVLKSLSKHPISLNLLSNRSKEHWSIIIKNNEN